MGEQRKPEAGMDQKPAKNRITKYLTPKLDRFLFGELPASFLEQTGTADILTGVPFPVLKTHLTDDALSVIEIARNMAFVLGCDPDFRYHENYETFIRRLFTPDFIRPLLREADQAMNKKDPETACVFCRAALAVVPEDRDAMLLYGQACHDCYDPEPDDAEDAREQEKDAEYVGDFKAESLQVFERLTIAHPDCAPAFYYLGYLYLNMGLYIKAKLTFQEFLRLSHDSDVLEEVRDLVNRLKDPCIIEEGCNAVTSGRYETGIDILSEYEDDERYNQWWPLWFYLALAYRSLGRDDQAETRLRKVLALSPSNTDAMEQLADIYRLRGDTEKEQKYRGKIRVVKQNEEMDREQKRQEQGKVLS